jgi:hypothetical protein
MSEELKPSDIVDRLRKPNRVSDWAAMLEAANLIVKLRAEIAAWNRRAFPTSEDVRQMREALEPFAQIALLRDTFPGSHEDRIDAPDLAITPAQVRKARAALSPLPAGKDTP